MAFTDDEASRIKHFLSYTNWQDLAASIHFGVLAGVTPLYLVESAMQKLAPAGEESVRRDLAECEAIERQLCDARSRFKATQIGNLKTNPKEARLLRRELLWWTARLADDLGCYPNPWSMMLQSGGLGGGVNARCVG